MKRRILNLTVVTFALLLGVATSNAQTAKFSVSVPFDFEVGGQHMPAGEYALATNADGYRLMIEGVNNSARAQVMTNSIGTKHPGEEPSRLVFRNVGNQHYLVQIWSAGLQDGRSIQLPKDRMIEPNGGIDNQETTISVER